MDIEDYKKINKELVSNVQELRMNVTTLERELIVANNKFFDERQKLLEERSEIEQKALRVINTMKRQLNQMCNNAIFELNFNEILLETPVARPRISLGVMRRSSMGVTMRSPLKSNSPINNESQEQPSAIAEEAVNIENESNTNGEPQNIWGLSNLEEDTENRPHNSSCQSVDTTINSPIEVNPENRINVVPNLHVNNRRVSQIWDRSSLHIRQRSQSAVDNLNRETNSKSENTATASENIQANSNREDHLTVTASQNSQTMDRLTMDFSHSLILHSTPHNSETLNSTAYNPKSTMQNQTDKSDTLTTSSSRPRRQCAPVKLTEPTLNNKMRNEEKTANKRQTRKKKRTK